MKYKKSAAVVYGAVTMAVVTSALPASRYLPAEAARAVKAVAVAMPQGWAFFTKDPTTAAEQPYVKRGERWIPVPEALALADAIGLSRKARAVDSEVASLAEAVDDSFVQCAAGADVQECARRANSVERSFPALVTPLCEPVLIRRAKPIPFAYGTRVSSMPSELAIARVDCAP